MKKRRGGVGNALLPATLSNGEKRTLYRKYRNSDALIVFQSEKSKTYPRPAADSGSGLKRIPHPHLPQKRSLWAPASGVSCGRGL